MFFVRLLLVGAFLGLIAWGAMGHIDPYRTRLPLDTTDLSTVQAKLDKLPVADRESVLAYVQRTGGRNDSSMLTITQLATMPNFKEAIALQKKWFEKEAARDAKQNAKHLAQDSKFDRIRTALQIEWVKRERIPQSQRYGSPMMQRNINGEVVSDQSDPTLIWVDTFRAKNLSATTIEEFEAIMQLRKAHLKSTDLDMPSGCKISSHSALIPFATIDLYCDPLLIDGRQDGANIGQGLIFESHPTYLRFADGKTLKESAK